MLAGIDLAWRSDNNPSGIAFGQLQDRMLSVTEVLAVCGIDTIISLFKAQNDLSGIAIDAPLIITNRTGQRSCERELSRAYGVRKVSCHASNMKLYPRASGVVLSNLLHEDGFNHLDKGTKWQIECYPHPAIIEIFGLEHCLAYKKGTVAQKKDGQIKLARLIKYLRKSTVMSLSVPDEYQEYLHAGYIRSLTGTGLKRNEDCLDAVLCLYIAGLYSLSVPNEVFGNSVNGYIYVPKVRCIQQAIKI